MATSKTLTPTNVTISIPEFTDQPDQRVNSNCIDKEADAINELMSKIAALNSNLTTPEDKKITRVGTYFTERDAFKARRMGNTVVIFSYVNITTQVPSGTNFADTGFPSAEGMYIFMNANGSNATMVTCTVGKLRPSDSALPTGYYYVSGCAVTPI